jgi:hypothetical protein
MPQGKPAGAHPHYEAQKISTVVAGRWIPGAGIHGCPQRKD